MMRHEERVRQRFCEWVQIYSPSKGERQLADRLKAVLEALGARVWEDEAGERIGGNCGNVFAHFPGAQPQAPLLLLTAHMDSVEPCRGIKPVLKDGVFRAAGDTVLGSDDKAGIVAIVEGVQRAIEELVPRGDVLVVFTVAEEGGLRGAKAVEFIERPAFGYALDSSGPPGQIIAAAPGQNSITATVHGKAAHAGVAPEEGVNAIVLAAQALAVMPLGRIDDETTANAGVIHGGTATNIVPAEVTVWCEARSRDAEKLAAQTETMRRQWEESAAAGGGNATVVVTEEYRAYSFDPADPVVQVAAQAAVDTGLPVLIEGSGGGSDANVFNSCGVPTAVLGVGMSKVHTTEEFIRDEHLQQAADWVLAIIRQVGKLP